MNNPELESILKRARLPEPSEESLELFPRQIVGRLKRIEPPVRAARFFSPRLAWAFGLAVCAALVFALGHERGKREAVPADDSLANVKLIHETLALFPNRVRAIVSDEHGLSLVLSDHDDVPPSTPLYIRICDGKNCSSFVTFSGQEIQIAGQKVTVLSDARGGIILAGNRFAWSNTERNYADKHLKIEARNLGAMAM
jgi:hypothetical protein